MTAHTSRLNINIMMATYNQKYICTCHTTFTQFSSPLDFFFSLFYFLYQQTRNSLLCLQTSRPRSLLGTYQPIKIFVYTYSDADSCRRGPTIVDAWNFFSPTRLSGNLDKHIHNQKQIIPSELVHACHILVKSSTFS